MSSAARDTRDTLAGIATGQAEALERALELRDSQLEGSALDPRTLALVRIAALIALDAPPAAYAWQVAVAESAGVTPEEVLDVLRAITPQVGGPRAIAAAPEIMLALGLTLPEMPE